ncbi:hypothetical protein HDU67_000759 [Dinochytrium kinnereticum]|nr:hypothetical protein HDU67_000759 [Dinochytrium kinnereticum]
MTVATLQSRLSTFSLDSTGKKAELLDRLVSFLTRCPKPSLEADYAWHKYYSASLACHSGPSPPGPSGEPVSTALVLLPVEVDRWPAQPELPSGTGGAWKEIWTPTEFDSWLHNAIETGGQGRQYGCGTGLERQQRHAQGTGEGKRRGASRERKFSARQFIKLPSSSAPLLPTPPSVVASAITTRSVTSAASSVASSSSSAGLPPLSTAAKGKSSVRAPNPSLARPTAASLVDAIAADPSLRAQIQAVLSAPTPSSSIPLPPAPVPTSPTIPLVPPALPATPSSTRPSLSLLDIGQTLEKDPAV